MAWIDYVGADGLADSVRALCARWKRAWSDVDNVIRIHGASPATLHGHLALYEAVLHGESPLSRLQRELIGVVVSAINRCEY